MEFAILVFFRMLPSVAAIAGATLLALHDKPGWGWMLFVSVLLGSVSLKTGV